MNNKPVAIVNTNCENNIQWYEESPKKHNGYFLYTHPVKELTDEEIIEIGLLTTDPRFSHIESPLLLEFARAILKKAQK